MSDPRQRDIVQYLARYNAWCRSCGYALRALEEARCPECGIEVTFGTILDRPPSGRAFSAGVVVLVSLCVASAATLATLLGARSALGAAWDAGVAWSAWSGGVSAIALGLWFRARRAIEAMSPVRAHALAIIVPAAIVLGPVAPCVCMA